jgi:AraC family transcriptional regulator
MSLKQYVLGRKLAVAAEKLKDKHNSVTDVAYELSFEYPEVFSRDFKRFFGMAPAVYRKGHQEVTVMPKAVVIDRDIMNFEGVPTLKETYVYLEKQNLHGVYLEVDENASDFADRLQSTGEKFFSNKQYCDCLKEDYFYTVVNCYGDESGRYSVFYGGELVSNDNDYHLNSRNIPAGWYACFIYHGDMLDMRMTFNDDFYKWVIVKEIELCPNGIGMLDIYDRQDMRNVRILIPVKKQEVAHEKS